MVDANDLEFCMISDKLIDSKRKITTEGREKIEAGIQCSRKTVPYKDAIQALLKTIWTGEEFKPEDERKRVVLNTNANFKKKEFQELGNRIILRTIYEVQFDTAKLIEDSRIALRCEAVHPRPCVRAIIRSGAMAAGGTMEQMEDGSLFHVHDAQSLTSRPTSPQRRYTIWLERSSHAFVPTRRTVVDILKAIKERSSCWCERTRRVHRQSQCAHQRSQGKPDHQQHRVPQNGGATRCENGVPQ